LLTHTYRLLGLFIGITVLLTGTCLLGSLLGVRATLAHFPGWQLGLIMSGYYAGFIVGNFLCPGLIRPVGRSAASPLSPPLLRPLRSLMTSPLILGHGLLCDLSPAQP
jgi:hypothetical protein